MPGSWLHLLYTLVTGFTRHRSQQRLGCRACEPHVLRMWTVRRHTWVTRTVMPQKWS